MSKYRTGRWPRIPIDKMNITQLKEFARQNLINIPTQAQRKTRGTHEIVAAVRLGESDLKKFGINRLRDFIRENNLMTPSETAKKDELIKIIEEKITRPTIIKTQSITPMLSQIHENLLSVMLLKLRVNDVFRLYQTSAIVRRLLHQGYWKKRLELEHFILPKFPVDPKVLRSSVFDWKEWYLEVTKYPIAGEVFSKGGNYRGELGFKSSKLTIDPPKHRSMMFYRCI